MDRQFLFCQFRQQLAASCALVLTTGLLLAGCGKGASVDHATTASAAPGTPVTLSPELQAIFDRSCKACHTNPGTGAPQVGDAKAWTPRVAQGLDTLLDHAVNGYKGMPPLGNCMDCKDEQFVGLIEYMSGTKFQQAQH